jgi:RNA ligase
LPTYFLGFSIWNERNECLSWEESREWFDLFQVTPVPVLYDGLFDETVVRSIWQPKLRGSSEGYVVRVADRFSYGEFHRKVGKFVRRDHVQTDQHWRHGPAIEKNRLSGE